ncbi:MAG: 50S ribosomal protein L4 [Candidatus Hatepunaea meridiana]|nr:50S ribosomal protein L4 [Candidatus Hatepunaea meridiana]
MADNTTTDSNLSTPEEKSSLKLPVKSMDGKPTGEEVELDPRLFGLPRNDHVLYLAVKTELTNRRQGTHATLTRAMVSGGGRKPWNQKGRGAARAGTSSSPIWRSGGITFGPQPQIHQMKLPAKVKKLARKIALSIKANSGVIDLVEDFDLAEPKTKEIASMLSSFDIAGKSILLMVGGHKPMVVMSCRNIPRLEVKEAMNASAYDILRARRIIISRTALDSLTGGLTGEK